MSSVSSWYALYLRSRTEKKVYAMLQKKAIESFLPLIEEVHVWSDRKKKVWEPLFRGYVFVKTDLRNKEEILQTEGVAKFVGFNGTPSRIPEREIDWLRLVVGQPTLIKRESYVNVGERVRVIAGPFRGIEGIVMRKQGVARIVISVSAIAQSVSVEVGEEMLERNEVVLAENAPLR